MTTRFERTSWAGPARNVVVCIDGTWNHDEQTDSSGRKSPTNVAKLRAALVQDDTAQVVGYFRGLGNKKEHWIVGQLLGGVFGAGAYVLLRSIDCWLTENWRPGDALSIFGFSRGAALARMLANSVRKRGIAKRIVFRTQRIAGKGSQTRLRAYRHEPVRDVPVGFLGCWDTVASFGIPIDIAGIPFQQINVFKDFTVSSNVDQAVHCLALDEERHAFVHTPMDARPNVEEVWFAGGHCDVGGGTAETGLSDTALEFMVARAEQKALRFASDWRAMVGLAADATGPIHRIVAPGGSERREAGADAKVHVSVRERIRRVPGYAPSALPSLDKVVWVR